MSHGRRATGRVVPRVRVVSCSALAALAGCARVPPVLATQGVTGSRQAALGWFVLIVSAAVVLVVGALVLIASLRRREPEDGRLLIHTPGELSWITIGGIIIPAIVLTVTFLFTVVTLNAVAAPRGPTAATIRVTGHQWWWEVEYVGDTPDQIVTTANEIHIPVGQPVRLALRSEDVIHSFWVPQLAGKIDLIPGQENVMWIQAKEAGAYLGRCGEYCGVQHANMQMSVVAQSRADYDAWLAAQRAPAAPPTTDGVAAGQAIFLRSGCANCHTVRGTPAGGRAGPDLTHLASRTTIAAGTLPNTIGSLVGWVSDPQRTKPGNEMPKLPVAPQDMLPLVTYLGTLR